MRHFIVYGCLIGICMALSNVPARAGEDALASLGLDGAVRVSAGDAELAVLTPTMASPQWSFSAARPVSWRQHGEQRRFFIGGHGDQAIVAGDASLSMRKMPGWVDAHWAFTAQRDCQYACLVVACSFEQRRYQGGTWQADAKSGTFPRQRGPVVLFAGQVRTLSLTPPGGQTLRLQFTEPTQVLIQDDRQWGATFTVRIGRGAGTMKAGESYALTCGLSVAGNSMTTNVSEPFVITEGAEWIALRTELDIVPGSALDLSAQGFADGPCGENGRIIVNESGRFVFEKLPQRALRFYGVNFCFDAQYLPKDQVDQVTDRLVRLGYNAVRLHHYDGKLAGNKADGKWDAAAQDRLDYFLYACGRRGLYVTTDLYVSRTATGKQVGLPDRPQVLQDDYKILPAVHEPAMRDWERFAAALLEHVNPYTKLRWADDPTLAWISLINEGNFGNYWGRIIQSPQWSEAWNRWLLKRYGDTQKLATAWGDELKPGEDCGKGTVGLPDGVFGQTSRQRDVQVFLAHTERDMFLHMKQFLRQTVGCPALLTNMNAWTNPRSYQLAREELDYVDDHFYVDHPQFLDQPWRLPSRCDNANPIKRGAPGGLGLNELRLLNKPFTCTEYNYAAPGAYRGVGGILTGAQAALQGWDAVWRFAYSHSDTNLLNARPMNYFDLATDPLNQAADRAAIMLFERGDLAAAAKTVVMELSASALEHSDQPGGSLGGGPQWIAWQARLGTRVVKDAPIKAHAGELVLHWPAGRGEMPVNDVPREVLLEALTQVKEGSAMLATWPNESGQIMIDAEKGLLRFDTPRTAGGFASTGQAIDCPSAGVHVGEITYPATVFASSLDQRPLRQSQRILVTHLTDLQNSATCYADPGRQVLLDWGKLPHLVRAGQAKITLTLAEPEQYHVYALATSGARVGAVKAMPAGDTLSFTCDVRGPQGAALCYEVVRQKQSK